MLQASARQRMTQSRAGPLLTSTKIKAEINVLNRYIAMTLSNCFRHTNSKAGQRHQSRLSRGCELQTLLESVGLQKVEEALVAVVPHVDSEAADH